MEEVKAFFIEWKIALLVALIIIGAWILTGVVGWLVRRTFSTEVVQSKIDATRYKFFANSIKLIIWLMAIASIISLIPRLRAVAISMFAGAGILLVFVGLAAQQAFSNIVGGIFIVLFKPFRVGDMIKVGSLDYGIVTDITLRHTVIRNFENNMIIIPNATVSSDTIINNSIEDPKVCRHIIIGISYESDLEKAIEIIQSVSKSHPNWIDNRTAEEKKAGQPQVVVRVLGFMESSVDLKAYVWLDNFQYGMQAQSDILQEVKRRFKEEGIEIPYPHRKIVK